MHLAHLFLLAVAACITAPCDPTDQRLQAEKNAALLAAYTEVVGPRFQLLEMVWNGARRLVSLRIQTLPTFWATWTFILRFVFC